MREQKVTLRSDMHTIGSGEAASDSFTMLRPLDQDPFKLTPYYPERKSNNMLSAQYENSLFSSSLSDLFCRKLGLSSNNESYGHSVNALASYHDGGEPFESLDKIEAQTIGDLLPDDDDLLSGVVDGLDFIGQPSNEDDKEEVDLFSSVGGMDLGDDGVSAAVSNGQLGISRDSIASLVQEFPLELNHIKRAHFLQQNSLSSYSNNGFSGPHPLSTTSSSMGNGNIRDVSSTVRGQMNPLLESGFHHHHGISSSVPNGFQSLLQYDSISNQSCLPESVQSQSHLKFDIHGSPNYQPHSLPDYHDGLTSSSSLCTMATSISQRKEIKENGQFCRVRPNGPTVELNQSVFGSANGSSPVPGHHFPWGDSRHPQHARMWPNSPSQSFVSAVGSPNPLPQLHGFSRAPSHMPNPVLPVNNHHVGSAPTVNPLWDRRHAFAGESPKASGFHPGSLESMRMSNNSQHSVDFVSQNIFPHMSGNVMDMPIPHGNLGFQSHQPRRMMFSRRAQTISMVNSFDTPGERARNRNSNQADNKKQFELDLDRIIRGEDNRTTLMIKNIPNKYTSKMLLAAIDELHKGTYDFIYLPIDFKNKCNVGYAFINMTHPKHIVSFYQTFDGKKWEKFNSEKVASLAYGRIQGKAALIAHFQNSSLMNEDKRCRPILFNTEGPNAGDQVPFPMGVNVRTRLGKVRTNTQDENNKGSPLDSDNEGHPINNNSFSVSRKESDEGDLTFGN